MSPPDNDNEDHSFPVISSPSLGNSRISDFDSSRTSPRSRQKFHKNSRLGTTHNTKTTSDLVQQQSITSQQSITENMDGKKPDSDPALTRERVIEIALMKMSHRRRQNLAPEAFDHYGNLKPLWSYLQGDINKARKERSAQAREEHKAKVHEKWDPVGSPQLTEQQSKLVKLRMKMLPNTKAESVNPGTKSPTPTSHPQDTIALDTESSTSSPTFPNRQTVVLGETTRPHDASRPKKTPKTVELRSQAPPASPKQGSDVQFCTKCFHKIELPCTGQDKTPMQHSTNRTEIGEEWLDDDEIRSPLTQLFGRVMQYAARACNRRWPQPIQILEVLGIRDEGHDLSAVSNTPIVKVMRDMLDVQAGITVVEKIRSFRLESENSLWIKAILCFLVAKFIFKNGSPFDDPLILLNSRARLGDGPRTFAEMLQRDRIRTMSATPRPSDFVSRIQNRRDVFVRHLNAVMMPLVGSSSEITSEHIAIAELAEDLNLNISAYKGNYSPIWPKTGEIFDKKEHVVENLDSEDTESNAGEERRILFTTMVGVKLELPDGDWRVCSQAKVRLWPPTGLPVEKRDHPSATRGKKRAREE